MAYDFAAFVSGEWLNTNTPVWVELLQFAQAYGWEPQGTALYAYAPGYGCLDDEDERAFVPVSLFLDYTPDTPCTTATFSDGRSSSPITVPVVPVPEWDGDYTANEGQIVARGDALALAEAVARGLDAGSKLPKKAREFFGRFSTFARNSGGFFIF